MQRREKWAPRWAVAGEIPLGEERENVLPQTLPIKLSSVVSKYGHISFWKYYQETLRELSIIKAAKGLFWPFPTSKISKVDKLAPRNTLHTARNRLYSWIAWYLRGLESISILMGVYTEVRHNLFRKTPVRQLSEISQKYSFFLGWYFSGPDGPWKTPIDFL